MSIEKVEVIIGCEIHTQLLTATKAFCACENRYGGMPNSRVCPVCLGLPGAMPRISNEYVKLGAVAGYALNCKIASFTKFDRKHYFYPDLAKGYQITQYDIPLCQDGLVELRDLEGNILRSVRVERIHLEEDVGKSLHLEGAHSYIDYNRSGTPLIEIVTKPDMKSPEEAALFMQTVQEILRYVGITKGNLEEGNMRCDANINLKITEEQLNQQIEHNLGQPSIEGGGESAPGTDPLQEVLNALKGMGFYQDLIDMVNQAVENGMTGAAADVAAKAAASIAQTVAYRILYLVGFTLILILWKVVSRTLNLVARLPGIHVLNQTLGGVFGLLQGCLILFVAAWMLQLMGNLIPQETVEQTVLLKFFMTSSPLALLSAL